MSSFERFMLWVIMTACCVQAVFLYFIMLAVAK